MLSGDAIILMALSLFVCGFLITRGALEMMALIMVPAIVMAVLAMKVYFPPELLMLAAGGVVAASLLSFKNMSILTYGLVIIGVAAAVLGLKAFLPVAVLTRLALSIVFLGLVKVLVL